MFEPAPNPTTNPSAASQPSWIAALSEPRGFVRDDRFDPQIAKAPEPIEEDDNLRGQLAQSYEEGHAAGLAEATQRQGQQVRERRKLGSSLRRMDEQIVERLSRELSETVVALCEATLAPLALDRDLLKQRCERAAQLLGERTGNPVLHLNSADIDALDDDFRAEWTIRPDDNLERGSLRIEGPDGGISDGPAQWRSVLAESLGLDLPGC